MLFLYKENTVIEKKKNLFNGEIKKEKRKNREEDEIF
jgi:hypothetical protein